MGNETKKGLNINVKSFFAAILIIFLLMVLSYILTFVIPGGEYTRVPDANGNQIVDTAAGFRYVDGGIPFWKWILSPVLVLAAEGNGTLIAVIAFLLVVGGVFNSLEKSGLMSYMLNKIVHRFGAKKYKLMAVIMLFFMAVGSFIGSFEECVPLVPIVVALTLKLGWDALTGLGISLLAVGCGFAAGICNPFTVGVAQKLAGLPMFSGIWLRLISFALIYGLLFAFVYLHAKKVDRKNCESVHNSRFVSDLKMDRALFAFAVILGIGIALVLSSAVFTALQDYTMIIVAVMFLAAGIAASLLSGMEGKRLLFTFGCGLVSILPAVLMILMAGSIKFIMVEAHILDTLLFGAVSVAGNLPQWAVILFVYLIALVMNFFISSGSAKAFLLMPLLVPLVQMFGISPQLCVLAYVFGDGFSNVFYPTNPVLLISLGLADVSYGRWVRWSWRFQIPNLILTSLLLLFGLTVGYT